MKKILYSMMAMAIAAFTFTACEDVPEPYNNPYANAKGEEVVEVDPVGSGTKDDPWNVTALANACEGLAEGAFLKDGAEVYVKGFVVETTEVSAQYGNATYYISDVAKNGKVRFYVFRGKLLDGASVTDANDLKVGDEVIVCGKVKNYKPASGDAVLEFDQGNYLVYLNGKTAGGDKPDVKTVGSKDAPKSVSEALAAINAMEDNAVSQEFWFVKGKVVKVTTTQTNFETYKNLNYLISEDGTETNTITVYSGDGLNGDKFTGIDALGAGDEVIVYGQIQKYVKNGNMTPEIAKGNYLVALNKGGNEPTNTVGSKDAPKSISEALAAINTMEDNAVSQEFWFVKGKVVKVTTNQTNFEKYGNLNYLISEDGTENNTITVYSGDGLNGDKFTGIDALGAGDEVIVYGQLQKYVKNGNMTPEIAKGNYLVSLNKGGSGETPSGETGSLTNPLTASQAFDLVAAMESGVTSEADYYVKGKVCSVKYTFSAQFGTATFNISDDGNTSDKEFIAYSCYYFNNEPWKEGDTQIQVGDEVIVCGKVINYNGNTPEFASKKNYLVSLNGNGNSDQGGGSATTSTITMADFGLENQAELTTLTASDGTKLTFSQEGGSNAPKYYTSGNAARMYALNSLTITANKAMTKVVLTCAMNGANPANGNDTMFGEAGGSKVTTNKDSDTQVTFSNFNNSTLKIVNDHTAASSGTQLRIVSIEITFAK